MPLFIGELVKKLVETIFDKLLGGLSERAKGRVFQRVGFGTFLVLLLGQTGLLIFGWQRVVAPGPLRLWQFAWQHGDVWTLAAPVLTVIMLIVLLLPLRGRYLPLLYLGFAAFGAVLYDLAIFQSPAYGALLGISVLSALLAALIMLMPMILLSGDVPALGEPLAALFFAGYYRHLLALRAFAERNGWQVQAPGTARSTLQAAGSYEGYAVTVTSGAQKLVELEGDRSLSSVVTVEGPNPLLRFSLGSVPKPRIPNTETRSFTTPARWRWPLRFRLTVPTGRPLPESDIQRLAAHIDAGRPYLRPGMLSMETSLRTNGARLIFARKAGFRLRERDAQRLAAQLDWMVALSQILAQMAS